MAYVNVTLVETDCDPGDTGVGVPTAAASTNEHCSISYQT